MIISVSPVLESSEESDFIHMSGIGLGFFSNGQFNTVTKKRREVK